MDGCSGRTTRHSHQDIRGVAALEAVICLPFVAFLLVGIVEHSLALRHAQVLADAARYAAREAAGIPTDPPLNCQPCRTRCLEEEAVKKAQKYLEDTLDSAKIALPKAKLSTVTEGGRAFSRIEVEITRDKNTAYLRKMLPEIKVRSSFHLEKNCS